MIQCEQFLWLMIFIFFLGVFALGDLFFGKKTVRLTCLTVQEILPEKKC